MLERHPEIKKTVDTFVNCFAAGDGGMGLVTFYAFMEQLGNQAEAGDERAAEIISRVQAVGRLVTHVTGVNHEL
jgi:hypothetical protein